jgi:hypothetical protein
MAADAYAVTVWSEQGTIATIALDEHGRFCGMTVPEGQPCPRWNADTLHAIGQAARALWAHAVGSEHGRLGPSQRLVAALTDDEAAELLMAGGWNVPKE